MRKKTRNDRLTEMRKEYDFRGGVRGKYAARFRQGTNIVVLEPDVAAVFPDSLAVNRALRALLKVVPRGGPGRRARKAPPSTE